MADERRIDDVTDIYDEAELESMLVKLAGFADTLEVGERAALNFVGSLAMAALSRMEEGGADVTGHMIVTGGRAGPGGGSGGGSGPGGTNWYVPAPPAPPIPIPYPNTQATLGSKFPF